MKVLTKAEDQIMQILWRLQNGFVRDVIEHLPEPKPAYNTVSTVIRILERKGFVGYKAYGKTHQYYPIIKKEAYTRFFLNNVVRGYFDGSIHNLVSFFAQENRLSVHDIDELVKELQGLKKK
jgi:predicted transcriptional regulator